MIAEIVLPSGTTHVSVFNIPYLFVEALYPPNPNLRPSNVRFTSKTPLTDAQWNMVKDLWPDAHQGDRDADAGLRKDAIEQHKSAIERAIHSGAVTAHFHTGIPVPQECRDLFNTWVTVNDFREYAKQFQIGVGVNTPVDNVETSATVDTAKASYSAGSDTASEHDFPGNPRATFRAMQGLTADEVTISFVGDKAESGLGANSMLEISARGVKKRVPLSELSLLDKNRGVLNGDGAMLLSMTRKGGHPRTDANAAKMKRLRKVLREYLGIDGDPFESFRKGPGWVPRFKIADNRGAADDRAKRDAEKFRTVSYEQLTESGREPGEEHPYDQEGDDADVWLKKNDPG